MSTKSIWKNKQTLTFTEFCMEEMAKHSLADNMTALNRMKNRTQTSPRKKLRPTWQTDKDLPNRRKMIIAILSILRQGNQLSSERMRKKLPHIAKYVEQHLYRDADSLQEYFDGTTLLNRIADLSIRSELNQHRRSQQQDEILLGLKMNQQQTNALMIKQTTDLLKHTTISDSKEHNSLLRQKLELRLNNRLQSHQAIADPSRFAQSLTYAYRRPDTASLIMLANQCAIARKC